MTVYGGKERAATPVPTIAAPTACHPNACAAGAGPGCDQRAWWTPVRSRRCASRTPNRCLEDEAWLLLFFWRTNALFSLFDAVDVQQREGAEQHYRRLCAERTHVNLPERQWQAKEGAPGERDAIQLLMYKCIVHSAHIRCSDILSIARMLSAYSRCQGHIGGFEDDLEPFGVH